ncbi:MAG: nucleotide sugar dehydrogenase [Bacteroidia bacterium]|nr:MAG: nucleotide sugar dehydrogenase [Bacteroidia bacterium]
MTKICVLGMGYIGLPTALLFANNGSDVVGVDINERVVLALNEGRMPFEENGFQELLDSAIENGSFRVQIEAEAADVFLVAVPTPLDKETKLSDLTYVKSACETIVPHLAKGNLVIIESTIPPKTCEKIVKSTLQKSGLKASEDFYIAHCPERAIPGNTLHEMVYNDRIIGGIDARSTELAESLYSSFVKGHLHLTNSTTAEMVKLMENTYRDINIALANELAQIADEYGVNVWDAIKIANKHPRVNILNPGPGVGGHCIAIDPWFLTEDTNKGRLISLSRQINDSMPQYELKLVREILVGVENPVITIFGVAYKGDIGDTRATPARKFIKLAEKEGYDIWVHDPFVTEFDYPLLGLSESLIDSDCIVLLTDHSVSEEICRGMRNLNIVDTRNVVDGEGWKKVGFNVKIIGCTTYVT